MSVDTLFSSRSGRVGTTIWGGTGGVRQRAARSVFVCISAVVFSLVLIFLYANDVVIRFDYTGLIWNPNWLVLITGFIVIAVVALWLPVELIRAGDILVYVLFCMVFIPAMLFPPVASHIPGEQLITFQMVFLACFLALLAANRFPLVDIDVQIFARKPYVLSLLVLTGLMALPVVYFYGVPTSLPTFADVYERRLASRTSSAAMPALVGYLWFWLAKVSSPYLFVTGVVWKSRLLIFTGVFTSLYLYGLTGSKTVVFSVGLILAVMIFLRVAGQQTLLAIIPALVVFMPLAYLLDRVVTNYWLTSLIARRTFMVPGILTGYYVEYFSSNPFIRWSNSFLAGFHDNPYGVSLPPTIIGREYFLEHTAANAHFWADGFANWGLLGMVIVTIPASILVWALNTFSVGKSLYIIVPLSALIGYTLANTAIFTALVTHGIGLILFLIALVPREQSWENRDLGLPARDGLRRSD